MSELIKNNDNRATIRWKLLTSVSALALTVSSVGIAHAEDTDRPLVWIELGGQAENISGQGEVYAPGFLSAYSTSSILQEKVTPLQAQRPPLFSTGEEAKISFQPENSDWSVSVSVRYGRSGNKRDVRHQTDKVHYRTYDSGHPETGALIYTQEKFVDSHVYHNESHSVLDFMAGKDMGLGMFGLDGSSVLSGGIRIAQYTSNSSVDMRARPDLHFKYFTVCRRTHSRPVSLLSHVSRSRDRRPGLSRNRPGAVLDGFGIFAGQSRWWSVVRLGWQCGTSVRTATNQSGASGNGQQFCSS